MAAHSTSHSASSFLVIVSLAVLVIFTGSTSAKLSTNFYSKSCPKVFSTVQSVVHSAISKQPRQGASLLRLHFHDCFVNGCDGSVLLDYTPTFTGEKTARPNKGSIRAFEIVDEIKSKVEKECPGVVSCADILAIAAWDSVKIGCDGSVLLDYTPTFTGEKTARPSKGSIRAFEIVDEIKSKVDKECPGVVSCADILAIAAWDSVKIRLLITRNTLNIMHLGGPKWDVKLGRKDSKTASLSAANRGVIPPPTFTLRNLINRFKAKGLSTKDMVALSGAHTIGQARCTIFRDRIYKDKNIDSSFAKTRQNESPTTTGLPSLVPPISVFMSSPPTITGYNPPSWISHKAFAKDHLLRRQLLKGPVMPSSPNPGTYIPSSTSTLESDNAAPMLGSLQKSPPPPLKPYESTSIPSAQINFIANGLCMFGFIFN